MVDRTDDIKRTQEVYCTTIIFVYYTNVVISVGDGDRRHWHVGEPFRHKDVIIGLSWWSTRNTTDNVSKTNMVDHY